ncbi:MAG: site-specific DNA-methyltransferase, partial [Bacteroidia bacterium]|nr:site-specific DNA-methyltransferase [Bacteroidia bacterium]
DLELTGFGLDEINDITAEKSEGLTDPDDAPEVPEEPTARLGDVWLLGRHRLMCGDSTLIDDVNRLMYEKKADMVFTDPPYNVNYEGKTKSRLKIENDKMGNDAFYHFLYDAFVNMFSVTVDGGGIYICHADSEGLNFRSAMIDAGWLLKQCVIWAKNSMVMGRQDYQWKHEPILYGWKPGAGHKWYGGRKKTTVIEDCACLVIQEEGKNEVLLTISEGVRSLTIRVPSYEIVWDGDDSMTTIWRIEKPLRNGEHPTMKPVAIPSRAIQNSSKIGDIVLDLFGGSGSTLIACEQLNRTCYMMELDPKYCDVIIKRWEDFTGQKAKLEE